MKYDDMPSLASAAHTHTLSNLNNLGAPQTFAATTAAMPFQAGKAHAFPPPVAQWAPTINPKKEKPMPRRIIQDFIADPDDNVPLEKSMLFAGDQKLTDATDQELFFEIDMRTVLDQHNKVRTTLIDKKIKDRTEYLEPAKIRDLKMVVVTVATF